MKQIIINLETPQILALEKEEDKNAIAKVNIPFIQVIMGSCSGKQIRFCYTID